MSKELEALEDIILYLNAIEPKGLYCKNIEIIKTALEDYEDMKFDYKIERLKNQALSETNLRNILRVKIIDTIREKGIDILALKQCKKCKTPKRYNEMTSYAFHKSLTQEEFDLYKETFL